jgi:TolB-like protein
MSAAKPQAPNVLPEPSSDRLDSWKEIAAYLKRDERTVRRWEKEGLPVRRHTHKKQASVYAYKPEIDAWWNDGQSRIDRQTQAASPRRPLAWIFSVGLAASLVVLAVINVGGLRDRLRGANGPPRIHALAVLPLENLSGDANQEFFADGLTEELVTELGKVAALRVISHTSVNRFKGTRKPLQQIARELQVEALVEGTVTREANRVRVTANLIQAFPEKHLWAESYDRDVRNVLDLQSEVARTIADRIKITVTPDERLRLSAKQTVNPEAHELYLKGTYYNNKWTKEGFEQGIKYFNQALEKEPRNARAYAGLAIAYGGLGISGDIAAYPKQKASALKAIEIDDTLAEAHNALAWAKFTYDWDIAGAEQEFRRAIELNPSYATGHAWYGMFLGMLGRLAESLQEAEQGRRLDPLSLPNITLVWRTYYNGHQYDKAIEVCREALEMDPTFVRARERLVTILEQKGDFEKAIEEHRQVYLLHGENRGEADREADSLQKALVRDGPRGYWLAKVKRFPSAKSLPGTTYSDVIEFASIQTHLGKKQEAFLSLQKACESHVPYLIWVLPGDPAFDPIRSDPRYRELLRCVHVSQ